MFKEMGALSATEGAGRAAMAGRPTHVHQGLIEVGAKQSKWRRLAVASSDVAVDDQLCYMSYSNCKCQYLNKTLESGTSGTLTPVVSTHVLSKVKVT